MRYIHMYLIAKILYYKTFIYLRWSGFVNDDFGVVNDAIYSTLRIVEDSRFDWCSRIGGVVPHKGLFIVEGLNIGKR